MVFVNRNGRILWSPGLNNGNTLDEAKLGTGESFYPIPAIREWLRGYLKGGRETRNVH